MTKRTVHLAVEISIPSPWIILLSLKGNALAYPEETTCRRGIP